jgi:tetraacyldisaccharide 4'-kinase
MSSRDPGQRGLMLDEVLVSAWYRSAWWLWLLRPVEAVFRTLAALRRRLYRHSLLPVYRPPVPVVVVGNITAGGTGKTPVVIALVESLQQRGIKVGVVSRGYGAAGTRSAFWVDTDSDAGRCGDEPLLIRRRTGCPCVVAPRRVQAVRALLARSTVDIIISDDGLQHYALARDLEIAILDQLRGTGNGFCLPAGPLREPVKRLREVDYVLHRGSADPVSGVRYTPDCLVNLECGEVRPATPTALAREVVAVAGIGQPGQFMDTLVALGFEPARHCFPDHHTYTASDFAGLGREPIIMTEKDAVKCVGLAGSNAWYLKITASVPAAVTNAVVALARP